MLQHGQVIYNRLTSNRDYFLINFEKDGLMNAYSNGKYI